MAFVTSFNETFANLDNWVVLSAANDSANGYPGGPYQFGTDEIETVTADPANLTYSAGNLRITPTRDGGGNWFSARIETARVFKPAAGSQMRIEARIQLPNVHGAAALGYWPAFWTMGSWQRDDRWIWPACFEYDITESVNAVNRNWSTLHGGPRSLWGGPFNEPNGYSNEGVAPASGDLWGGFHVYAMEWDRRTATDTFRWYVDGNQVWTAQPATISPTDWAAQTNQPGVFIILNVAMGGQFPAKLGGGPNASTVPGNPMVVEYVRVSYDGTEAAEAATGNDGRGGTSTPPDVTPPPGNPGAAGPGTRTPIATSPPLFSPGTSYFTPNPNLSTLAAPYPTNQWFMNFMLGTGSMPVNVFPYQVKMTTQGLDICVPALNTTNPAAVLATMLQNISLRSTSTSTAQKVTGFTDLGCSVTWSNGMSASIVRGMAYVSMTYAGSTPLLNSQNAVINVNGSAVGATGTFTGSKFKFTLNNGQTWILYSSGSITLTLSTANTFTAGGAFTGTLKLALLPTGGDETTLDTYSAGLVTGGFADYTVAGNTATEVYTWSGTGPYLIYAMPHHQSWLTSPNYPAGLTITTLRGPMRAVAGTSWTMSVPLPTVSWNSPNSFASNRVAALTTAMAGDRSFIPVMSDPYFGGKQLAKSAHLALIADKLGDTPSRTLLLNNMKPVITAYLTGGALRYDTAWGGVVSVAGLSNQDADFGNGRYNDHHFHYGYAIYAAAVLGKFDSDWLTTYRARVNELVRDIANPSTADPYFTPIRNYDWFESHSWAAGNFEFADNRNQESTSEAVNAWYGLYLWGVTIADTQITNLGRLLMAHETGAAQRYWQIKQSDTIYPAPFKQNGVVGIVWSSKVDYATWFGAQAEYIFGIQMLPTNPSTEVLISKAWITEAWTNNILPLWTRSSVWRAQLISGGSGYVPQQVSPTGVGFSNGLTASGGSGSGLGFNVNLTPGGAIESVYIIFNQHGTGYVDGDTITLNGSGGTGAQVKVYTQPEDGWKAVLLGAYALIAPDDAWVRTQSLAGFDDGSSRTQALAHIAQQVPDTGTTLAGSAQSTSVTGGTLGITGGAGSAGDLTGAALSRSSTNGALAIGGVPPTTITKVGTTIQFVDTLSVTTRNTPALPATLATGNVITFHVSGGSSAGFHLVSSVGVTWTQLDTVNTVPGLLDTMWIGLVTNGATAASTVVTAKATDSTGVTLLATRMWGQIQCWSGLNGSGTGGLSAINQYAKTVSAASAATITTPNTPATTVPNCVLWSAGTGSRSTAPALASVTYEGGTPDATSPLAGPQADSAGAVAADLAPILAGGTPGGKVFAFFDATPVAANASPRSAWSLALAPNPTAPTVTASVDQTDPATGTALTLTGVVTGAATSRLWRQVSGPSNPAITNNTANVATVTPTLPGTYVFGFTATNAAGTSPEAMVTAYVHPGDGIDVPVVSVTLPAAWTVFPGGTALANITDSDPSTGIQNASGTPSHTDKATLVFAPMGPGGITFDLYSFYVATGVTGRAIVYKPDGVTQVYPASGGHDWTPTTTETLHTVTLDATALASLTTVDRRALVVKISAQ